MVERSQKEVWRLTPWLVLVLLLGNFILMAFSAKDITSGQRLIRVWGLTVADFVQSPVATISSGVTNYFRSIANLRSAQDENTDLKQKVEELQLELKAKEGLTAENERLKNLLDLKDQSKYKVLTARIIGRDPSLWFDSAVINQGSLNGVKLNMPVVANGGLVGRVTAVSPLTAQIDLLTRDKSGVGAVIGQVGTSNALGVVMGTSKNGLLEMKYVPGTTDVQVGQSVFTTGQDGIYPAGLKVGDIFDAKSYGSSQPYQILIQPAASLDSIQEVGVLLYEPPPTVPFDQKVSTPTKEKKK
ncbi:MAG TPA: rod shape-determining protein MreC [Pyrinomonadaceae bacterium]|jgi:rod shape-determining protein MreC